MLRSLWGNIASSTMDVRISFVFSGNLFLIRIVEFGKYIFYEEYSNKIRISCLCLQLINGFCVRSTYECFPLISIPFSLNVYGPMCDWNKGYKLCMEQYWSYLLDTYCDIFSCNNVIKRLHLHSINNTIVTGKP